MEQETTPIHQSLVRPVLQQTLDLLKMLNSVNSRLSLSVWPDETELGPITGKNWKAQTARRVMERTRDKLQQHGVNVALEE